LATTNDAVLAGQSVGRINADRPVAGDEVGYGASLSLETRVNGAVMQQSNTSDLIFGIEHLVAEISTFTTLYPGDVILTGTPGGVGDARKPPVYLQAGDSCEITIEGLGALRNRFVAA
jgi:2-keto-4-pentenoate hydratase/2-oxohepta-3-ene-1,7-dioic acid hydratase in catechol pathway